ncbi:MAG: hypothetical protein ACOYW9_00240 [Deinococcota bacterium]
MLASEYPLYRSNTAVLQAIVAKVAKGYIWYFAGEVATSRVLPLVEKLAKVHHVLLHPNHQTILKQTGYPTARLVLADKPIYKEGASCWPFVLLSTQSLPGERMFSVDDAQHPFIWRSIYQLYRTEWQRWSWRLCEAHFQSLLGQVLAAACGEPGYLTRRLDGLTYYPRFHGVHQDLRRLIYAAQRTWGASHRGGQHRQGMAQPDWDKYLSLRPLRGVGTGLYARPPQTLGQWLETQQSSAGSGDL